MKVDAVLLFDDRFGHYICCQQKSVLNEVVNELLECLHPPAGVEDLKYVFHLFKAFSSSTVISIVRLRSTAFERTMSVE
jgi:hypothetical protein